MLPIDLPYLRARLEELPCPEPVLEIGAGWDHEFHRGPLRARGCHSFFTHDVRQYSDAPPLDFLGDICGTTSIPESFAGTCLVFYVLEHVYAPWRAVDEIWRITKPGGVVFGAVPLRTAIHRHDKDYWRFCPDGLAYLLRRFRLHHFAIDGNVALPANLLFTAVKVELREDWLEHNQETVLRPEVILGHDHLAGAPWKRWIVDLLRRRMGLSLERWDRPWNDQRMRELGFEEWTTVSYSTSSPEHRRSSPLLGREQ